MARRLARSLASLAAAIALGLVLWWWAWPTTPAAPDGADGPGMAQAPASGAASAGAPGSAWSLLDHAAQQADAAEQEARRNVQICGFGTARFSAEADRPDAQNPGSREDQQEMARLDQWSDAALHGPLMRQLAASQRPMDRVAAALLQGSPDRAAEIAREAQDPRAYALAFTQCRSEPGPGCASLSAAEWAARDPDNAMPWWHVAAQALRRGDAAGTQQALRQAQAATQALDSQGLLVRSLADADADAEQASPLVLRAVGMSAALPIGWVMGLNDDCRQKAAYRQGPLRQACEALAGQLLTRAPSLQTRLIVARFARQSGMAQAPDEAGIARLRQALVFSDAQRVGGDLHKVHTDCGVVRAILKWETRLASQPEADAVRQAGGPAF